MNASFRTAFWAMCMGLTVPMVLLVGVELTSGGRAARKSSLPIADSSVSLRSQWEGAGSKHATRDASAFLLSGKSGSHRRHVSGDNSKPDAADAAVVGSVVSPRRRVDQDRMGVALSPGHDLVA